LLSELHPNGASQSIKGNDARRQEKHAKNRLGEVFTWLCVVRRRVENGETELALAAIDRVETVVETYL
jgi:hypothetical protein